MAELGILPQPEEPSPLLQPRTGSELAWLAVSMVSINPYRYGSIQKGAELDFELGHICKAVRKERSFICKLKEMLESLKEDTL